MRLENERIVVTGGAGFIGSHVMDALVAVGARPVAVDDLSVGRRANLEGALGAGAELIVGDIRDDRLMLEATHGAAAVIHMACDNLRASLADPNHTHDVNSTGTLSTVLAAVESGVGRFIYVSSSEAYGSGLTELMDEGHPLLPTTVYGASKAAGELYAQACMRTYGLQVTVIRPFNSYGPREHAIGTSAEVIPKFASRILKGKPPIVFGDGSQTRDFTWVTETAAGIVAATESDKLVGDVVNLAYGQAVSIGRIATLLIEIIGADGIEVELTAPRPGDVEHHWADTSRARELLDWSPEVNIEEGLRRYVAWLQAGGPEVEAAETDVVRNW